MAGWAYARGRRAAGHMVHASAKGLYHAEAATLTTANEIVLDFGPRPTAKIAVGPGVNASVEDAVLASQKIRKTIFAM
jgi:hypothetical protein